MNAQSSEDIETDMRAEYDFSKGVRGKYASALREKGIRFGNTTPMALSLKRVSWGKRPSPLRRMCGSTSLVHRL